MFSLEHVGDGDHYVERGAAIAACLAGLLPQGLAQVEQVEFLQPLPLLKGQQAVQVRGAIQCCVRNCPRVPSGLLRHAGPVFQPLT